MNKDNVLIGIIGLLIGLIIGFTVANKLNQSAVQPVSTSAEPASANPNLPANHPPFVPTGDQAEQGPRPEVLAAIEKAKQNPGDFESQMTAADLYYQIQRYDDAAKFYEAANKLRPNELEAIVKLGNSLFDAEKFEQAEKWYSTALQKTPNDVNIRTDYGLTFFLRNPRDGDRAIKEYKIALGIDANHELTLQNLAIAYQDQADTENLRKTLDALKTVNPNNQAIKELEAKSQTN